MTHAEYIALYQKFLQGDCSPEEVELLQNYQDDFTLTDIEWDEARMGDQDETKREIYSRLDESIRLSIRPVSKPRHRFTLTAVAAALVLLLASVGAYFWIIQQYRGENRLADNTKVLQQHDVAPGGDKAVLTLADGSQIVLDSTQNNPLPLQGNTSILKLDGLLAYNVPDNTTGEILYNTVSTPRGGQYQVVLPDGTRVWLNAASSLRFPTAFTGKDRHVELTGEAYFEVAKDKSKPFIVAVQDMQVEVLGTHFNIMAYGEETSIKTTLLEGSVKVTQAGDQKVLRPGQQAMLTREPTGILVEAVNTEEAVAWKNGYFIFENESIESIMRKVSRWYDIEVSYQGKIENMHFVGKISRYENVSEVLKMLELTGAVHFKIEERRVTVMP